MRQCGLWQHGKLNAHGADIGISLLTQKYM